MRKKESLYLIFVISSILCVCLHFWVQTTLFPLHATRRKKKKGTIWIPISTFSFNASGTAAASHPIRSLCFRKQFSFQIFSRRKIKNFQLFHFSIGSVSFCAHSVAVYRLMKNEMKRVKKKTPKTFSLTWNYIRIKDEKRIEIMETASLKKTKGKTKIVFTVAKQQKKKNYLPLFFMSLCVVWFSFLGCTDNERNVYILKPTSWVSHFNGNELRKIFQIFYSKDCVSKSAKEKIMKRRKIVKLLNS